MSSRFSWYCVVCFLAFAWGGCRLVSVEEEDVPFFEVSIGDVEIEGVGAGRMSQENIFQLWGQFVYPDSSFRFIEFSVANFEETGAFPLGQTVGSYGLIDARERTVRLAFSAGAREDEVRIDRFENPGVVQGRFSFEVRPLDGFEEFVGSNVTIEGAFLIELQ